MKELERIRNLAIVLCLLTVIGLFPEWYPEEYQDLIGFMWLILTPTVIPFVFSINEDLKEWRKEHCIKDVKPYITVDSNDKVFCATYYDHHSYTDSVPVFIPVLCGPTRKYQVLAWLDAVVMAFMHQVKFVWRNK